MGLTGASLIITVGIPGCGKSTFAKFSADRGLIVDQIISSDTIREELTGDMTNQGRNGDVFKALHERTFKAIASGQRTLVDATNLKPVNRREIKRLGETFVVLGQPVDFLALRFTDSENFDLCQERNLARERVVPEDVMRRFHASFLQNCTAIQLRSEGWEVLEI